MFTSFVSWVPNTPTGADIALFLESGLSLRYADVITEGQTSLDFLTGPFSFPTGYKGYAGSPAFDLFTTAVVAGASAVTLNYSDAGLLPFQEEALRLLHLNQDGEMEDVTSSLDTVNNRLAGATNQLGVFAVGIRDTFAPSAITDLTARTLNDSSVELSWTAPGDDQIYGQARSYDVRYATFPIDDANFSLSFGVINGASLSPASAGSTQSVHAMFLSPETTYYFAIKTMDAAGNVSLLSNISTAATRPVDTLPPATELKMEGAGYRQK
jgi:hypothetical protein